MAELLFAALFYIFLLVGSFSLGYLVLRFVYPEIRTFDKRNKMVTVGIVGAAITLSTIALDYSLNGSRVAALDSFSMPLMFVVTLFYFLVLRVYFLYSSVNREFITVGIPIAATMPSPRQLNLPSGLKKVEIPQQAVKAGPMKKPEQPNAISKKIEEIKKKIEEKKITPPAEAKGKSLSSQVELETLERKIRESVEKEKTSEVKKLQEEKRQLQRKLDEENAKRQAESVKQQAEKAKELKQLESEKKALEEEKRKLQGQFDAELKSREADMRKKLVEENKTLAEQEKKKSESLKKLEVQRRAQEERDGEARKQRLQASIGESETYLEKIKQRVEEMRKVEAKQTGKAKREIEASAGAMSVQEVKSEHKVAQLKKDFISQPVEVKIEVKTVSPSMAVTPAVGGALVPVPLPPASSEVGKKQIEVKKQGGGGFFASLFGGKKEPLAAAGAGSELTTWRKAKEEEAKKLSEKKKEADDKKAKAQKEEKELEDLLKTVTKEAEQSATTEESGGPVHRRYLLKGQVKVIASKDVAQKEEFAYMVQDVYSQLRSSQSEATVADVLKVDAPKQVKQKPPVAMPVGSTQAQSGERKGGEKDAALKTAPASAAQTAVSAKPEAGVSVSDILGTDLFGPSKSPTAMPSGSATAAGDLFASEAAPAGTGGGDIFARLSQAASGEKLSVQPQAGQSPASIGSLTSAQSAAGGKSDVSFVQIQAEKGVGCPTCHAKSSKIIFCPYCSTGMCTNCSPSIKPIAPGQFIYVCPKCGEEVSVKKKAS